MKTNEAAHATPWLPEGYAEVERVDDEVEIDGLVLGRAGVCVKTPSGEAIVGSAASLAEHPMARAQFEIWERIATVQSFEAASTAYTLRDVEGRAIGLVPRDVAFLQSETPSIWRYARSSGVALHERWSAARDRAWWELCERDRVLRAWYGDGRPMLLDAAARPRLFDGATRHDWQVARFSEGEVPLAVEVVGVLGFPRSPSAPMVVGFAARPTLIDAVDAATREALQQLAFLWGEAIPTERPAAGPTPSHHVDHLLWPGSHEALRAWIEHGHERFASASRPPLVAPDGFIDLTPPWLEGRAVVVRAVARDAVALTFGQSPFGAHLPPDLRMHPIG